MSRLEELIQEYCPDGVEYLALWKITSWDKQFNSVKKEKQPTKENFKHVSSKIIKELKCNGNVILLSTGMFEGTTTLEKAQNYLNEGEVIAIPSGGNATVKYNKGKFVDSGNLLASTNQNTKYVYYCLLNNLEFIQNCYRGSGIKHPDMSKILELEIPVPPLPVQQEIVHILDSFTTLTAELEARKKQYEFYKCKLLNTPGEMKQLDDVAKFGTGSKPTSIITIFNNNLYEYINAGTTNSGYSERANRKGNAITTPSRGQGGIGFVGYQENDFWLGPLCYAIYSKDEKIINPKYLYYELVSKTDEILKRKNTGGVPSLNGCDLKTIPINVPSIEQQNEIVCILDNFYKICNDISSGLPAEIEARQKQYEYYRDKLLTFKRLDGDE